MFLDVATNRPEDDSFGPKHIVSKVFDSFPSVHTIEAQIPNFDNIIKKDCDIKASVINNDDHISAHVNSFAIITIFSLPFYDSIRLPSISAKMMYTMYCQHQHLLALSHNNVFVFPA